VLAAMKKALEDGGATLKIVAPRQGEIKGSDGKTFKVDESFLTTSSVLFDAVYVPGGADSVEALRAESAAIQFVNEAYKHCKAIGAEGEGSGFLEATFADNESDGIVSDANGGKSKKSLADRFIAAVGSHRFWTEEEKRKIPA